MEKWIARLSLLLLLLAAVSAPEASAFVIYRTSFEEAQNWTRSRPAKGLAGYDYPAAWAAYNGGNPVYPPPRKTDNSFLFDLFRVGATLFDPPFVTNQLEIGGGFGRTTAKGMLYNVEVSGTTGTWSGGDAMHLWLGNSGYSDIYVRFYLKYPPEWTWTNDSNPIPNRGAYQKIMKVARYNGTWGDAGNPTLYTAPSNGGVVHPVWIPDWYQYISTTPSQTYFYNSERYSPDYTDNDPVQDFYSLRPGQYPNGSQFKWPSDAGWHCYEFRAKLNTPAGETNGKSEVWLDGVRVWSKNNIVWVKSVGSVAQGWNDVTILDNATIPAYPLSSHVVYPLYLDDVVVSTHYSGPPAKPTNVIAEGINASSIKLQWTAGNNGAIPQLDGYSVYYGKDQSSLTRVDVGNVTQYEVQSLEQSTQYSFYVTAFNTDSTDNYRNESLRSDLVKAVTQDSVKPDLTIAPVTTPTKSAAQTISGTVSDAGGVASVTVTVGEREPAAASIDGNIWRYSIPALTEGGNGITVTAKDLSENQAVVEGSILLDTVPPVLTVRPVVTPTIFTSQTLSGTVSDAVTGVSTVQVQVAGGEKHAAVVNGSGEWSYLLSNLQAGVAAQITVTALDTVGNESGQSSAVMAIGVLKAGDLSGDVAVGVEDAQLAMQMGAGLKQPDVGQLQRGDLAPMVGGVPHPDGVIDTGDAVLILGIVTGMTQF